MGVFTRSRTGKLACRTGKRKAGRRVSIGTCTRIWTCRCWTTVLNTPVCMKPTQRSKSNWQPAAAMLVRVKNSTTGARTDSGKSALIHAAPNEEQRDETWRNTSDTPLAQRQLRHKNWTGTCTVLHSVRIELIPQYPGPSRLSPIYIKYCLKRSVAVEGLALRLCIREVPGSILGPEIGLQYSWTSLTHPGKYQGSFKN